VRCNICDKACETCVGEDITHCTMCNDGWYPDPFDFDPLNGRECFECDSLCETCTGAANYQCQSCVDGSYY
jgi:hypothetical protein